MVEEIKEEKALMLGTVTIFSGPNNNIKRQHIDRKIFEPPGPVPADA